MERRRRPKRRVSETPESTDEEEENWSRGRRPRRNRKQINYKFEEFDELISGAIEDDVKSPESARKCFIGSCYLRTVLANKLHEGYSCC